MIIIYFFKNSMAQRFNYMKYKPFFMRFHFLFIYFDVFALPLSSKETYIAAPAAAKQCAKTEENKEI